MSQSEPNPSVRPRTVHDLILSDRLLVIAHRGNCRIEPENTLPAFRSALDLGVDLVELDYQQSNDGTAVVIHDADLDRTTNARDVWGPKVRVADVTWTQLARLDAGSWFRSGAPAVPLATLEDAVKEILPRAAPLIERKSGDAANCIEALTRAIAIEQVVVQAFDWPFLSACRQLAPQLAIAALGEHELTEARLDSALATGARVIAWDVRNTNSAAVAAIHRRGAKAWVWTCDEPVRMLELAEAGIDAIITNEPALAIETLADHPRRKKAC